MGVPNVFGTLTGAPPIKVPAKQLDDNFSYLDNLVSNVTISILSYGGLGNGAVDNTVAYGKALTAALLAGTGSTIIIPAGPSFYAFSGTLTVPQGVNLRIDGEIRNSAVVTSLVNVTATANSFVYGTGKIMKGAFAATNGIAFNPDSPFDNRNVVMGLHIEGFVNNIRMVTGTYVTFRDVFSQNATGNTLYATAGTGMLIDGLKVLGDANGVYLSATTLEGVILSNCQILTVAVDAYAFKCDNGAGLFLQISNVVCQGSVIFDYSAHSGAFIDINALEVSLVGGTSATTVGVDIIGNITDIDIDGLQAADCPKAGLRIRDSASSGPQRIFIRGFTGLSNGTAAGSADLILDASNNQGMAKVFVDSSSFLSTGGSVKSVLEIGPGPIGSTYGSANVYSATSTLLGTNPVPVSGGVPYINSQGFQSYSAALGSANVVVGGGAGNPPITISNLGWNTGSGNLEIAGGVKSSRTNGLIFLADQLGTNAGGFTLTATGNTASFWTEGSSAGATFTNSAAYATLLGGSSADTQFATSNAVRGGVNNAGTLYSLGTLQSAAPSGSTAGLWKLGAIKAGGITVDTSRSIQVDIGGVVYNVVVST